MSLHVQHLWQKHTGFELTSRQTKTIESVLGGVDSADRAVIEGPAGTGKSTLMAALIVEAVHQGVEVQIAAPTHKAAKVLGRLLSDWENRLGVMLPEPVTIHSLLKLVPVKGRPGQPETLRQKGTPDLGGCDLLIVDECSMIGKDLYTYIVDAAEDAGIALLFTGDSCQLQPVNEYRVSPTFTTGTRYVLNEVLRHDGAVLKLATRARKLKQPQVLPDAGGSTEVRTYAQVGQLKKAWLEQVEQAHELGVEAPVMLCWTNDNRRTFNREARQRIHGVDVPDFMQGDRLVTLSAYMVGDRVVIHNNVDLTVIGAEFVEAFKPVEALPNTYAAWKLKLREFEDVAVLADSSRLDHKRDLRAMGEAIKKELKDAEAKVKSLIDRGVRAGHVDLVQAQDERDLIHQRWRTEYFPLKEAFIDVDFNYACTIHKSQGSTYQDVFIWNDYVKSSERKELLYVAVTRAAKSVHHLHVGLQREAA